MALPVVTDESKSTWTRADIPSLLPALTALVVALPAPSTGSATANLTSDTFFFRADNGLWDDTISAWVPLDRIGLTTTPRK